MAADLIPTEVYDSYWRFAAERQSIYFKRLSDPHGPWTDDEILRTYRFTNVYRAADRVSQYLIREVQYRGDRSQAPAEVFFRTMLFKLFNKIESWELLESRLGPISWQSASLREMSLLFDDAIRRGKRIYSAAYIMPPPALGYERKHANHLALLESMMADGLPERLRRASTLRAAYEAILAYRGLGPFLAFQYAIDLNYSTLMDFDENDLVIAGPGALDGIAKCFSDTDDLSPAEVIYEMVDRQDQEFDRLGLDFRRLFGRRMQPIDCQNVFCEISKYARVAHPDIPGIFGRTRIKQGYRRASARDKPPTFPPKWNLSVQLPFRGPHAEEAMQASFL